ncbi:MAG: glycoside hydrolase family 127 protein [Verrucomicrobia bacterium]|nr:glycoside hydrolase family 127 protein [Verrucomicrobiota bacterium]
MTLATGLVLAAEQVESDIPIAKGPFQPTWDSLQKHQTPAWYEDAKFGIYAHWGGYCVPAFGNEWYPRGIYIKGSAEYKHHLSTYGDPSKFGYKDFIPMFKAEKFDADAWAELYARAGAKFAGPVAEHHDGFSMWASKVNRWNAKDMGPHRDVVGELLAAIHKQGLKSMVSFHHHYYMPSDFGPTGYYQVLAGSDVADPQYADLYQKRPFEQEHKVWLRKIMEVVDSYQPDLVWMEMWSDKLPEVYRREALAHYFNRAAERNKEVVFTHKGEFGPLPVLDLERRRKDAASPEIWQTDDSIAGGTWCYVQGFQMKPVVELIHELIDIVSKNKTLLLNVCPMADGSFPDDQKQLLYAIGDWLKVNGEAIYATQARAGDLWKEGNFLRFTKSKDDKYVYAISLRWPGENLRIKTVQPRDGSEIRMLGFTEPLPWKWNASEKVLSIQIPKALQDKDKRPCRHAYALKIEQVARVVESGAAGKNAAPRNLAKAAQVFTSAAGHKTLTAPNNSFTPPHSNDTDHGTCNNSPQQGMQWVEYRWSRPINTDSIEVYWHDDNRGIRLPKACRLQYWDGNTYLPVKHANGLEMEEHVFINEATFEPVQTTRLRLEFGSDSNSTGILVWRVSDAGGSPAFPPTVAAGGERTVITGGKTLLKGSIRDDDESGSPVVTWSKLTGPGEAQFADAHALSTTAVLSAEGSYELKLSASSGGLEGSGVVHVDVLPMPPKTHLQQVAMQPYKVDGPLWNGRIKALITQWIPHCYNKLSDTNLPEGGIQNFVEAAKKLAGQPAKDHSGWFFSNAYVHNTVEAMCWALMVDAQGDKDILVAQAAIREKLADWIPKILAAQEPNGYLQTFYTIKGLKPWTNRGDHEGYVAGYFIESAIAHYEATKRTDERMIRAARKLADCWCEHIGPAPKMSWFDGHQEMELALQRLAEFVDKTEGPGAGDKYLQLSKFLLDCRGGGGPYDQAHLPVTQQYEAVGHAVRAAYSYAAMAGIAMETHDIDYLSAVQSIWHNLIDTKYYVTGGIGSGETDEGFGANYSLPNNGYCESCSSCGLVFLQHTLDLTWHDARYADLLEETLYNALLGSVDLEGKNFTYTNALDDGGKRYLWHGCPCCVGNIPRTLLMLPAWTYAKGHDSLYVNLFIGSTMTIDDVAETRVEMVQETDYPWNGKVSITVNPAAEKHFSIKVRVPNRSVSKLYTLTPNCPGLLSLAVNGQAVDLKAAAQAVEQGYTTIDRTWKAGDRIEFELPMPIQRAKADERVVTDRGRVALRCGPIIYCIESEDQQDFEKAALTDDSALATAWKPELLGGVTVIEGAFSGGAKMTAIPYYARNNRGGRSIVWIKSAGAAK